VSRLADRLGGGIRVGFESREEQERAIAESTARASQAIHRDSPVYEISNVLRLYREQRDQYPNLDSFPMVAPPHDNYLMEARWPQGSLDGERFTEPKQVGLLFARMPDSEGWDGGPSCALAVLAVGFWRGKPDHLGSWRLIIDEVGGLAVADPTPAQGLRRWHSRRVAGQVDTVARHRDLLRDLEGRIESGDEDERAKALRDAEAALEDAAGELEATEAELAEIEAELDKVIMGMMEREILYPALLTHSLLNCRNVEVETNAPPAKLSKRHQRKRGAPMVKFKTLKVNPMGGGRRSSSGGGGTVDLGGGQTALHIVRGHFKTYTADRPLLGRHVGTYWWQANVRGSIDNGVVVKDYEVEV